jgi:hypothetical protein
MEKRVLVPVLLALAVGLALGAVGPATASGLTRGAVKRLATKVVTAKAPSLSVAYADTAGSATTAKDAQTLGGVTAAQLGVRPIVFTKSSGSINSGNGINPWTVTFTPVAGVTSKAMRSGTGPVAVRPPAR